MGNEQILKYDVVNVLNANCECVYVCVSNIRIFERKKKNVYYLTSYLFVSNLKLFFLFS